MPRLSLLRCAAIGLASCLSACGVTHVFAPTEVRRGEIVDQDALRELVPGTTTRADVSSLLGSPTAHATFDDNTWIYIGQVTTTRIGRTPGVAQQKVTVLTFDAKGTLRGVKQLDRQDARDVAMAAGATPSPGSEASFMQQLVGNVGRFNPAGLPGSGGGGFGSGGGSGGTGGSSGNSLP